MDRDLFLRAKAGCGGWPLLLLNHLIRPLQERRRDGEAEGLGGLEVENKLELLRGLRGNHAIALYLNTGITCFVRISRLRISWLNGNRPPGFSSAAIPVSPSSSFN